MKILVTGAIEWNEKYINQLINLGNDILYIQDERVPLKEQN